MSSSVTTMPTVSASPVQKPILPYRVRVVRTQAEFDSLSTEWDDFLQASGIHNLCMTHGWLSLWLKHFGSGSTPLIIIVQDSAGAWVGLAPLQISRSRKGLAHRLLRAVQWIGTAPTVFDWMQFIIRPDADETTVLSAIAQGLQREKWDLLDLQFSLNKAQLESLRQAFPSNLKAEISITSQIPYLSLPDSVEEYEPTRRKKTRLEVNRHNNRFAKEFGEPPELVFLPAGEASDAILTRFFSGHIKYWAEKGQKSDFLRYPRLYDFYKDMLAYADSQTQPDAPRLLLSILSLNEYQLSYHLGFWQGNSYLSHLTNYNQGFKGYSPGTIHMDKLIFASLERGGIEFEFGRGDEPYKKMWTQSKKPLWQLRVFRSPWASMLWSMDIRLKKLLKKGVS